MVKASDVISQNDLLKDHWIKRLIAVFIDAFLLLFVAFLVAFALGFFGLLGFFFWFFYGLIAVFYFAILEAATGATLGKMVLNLRVVSTEGPLGITQVLIRNLSKVNPGLILLDFLIGFVTEGDPRQKFLDRMAKAVVVRTDDQGAEDQFRVMATIPAAPPATYYAPTAQGTQPVPQSSPQAAGAWAPAGYSSQDGSQWPQHRWDEQGQPVSSGRFCPSCGGPLETGGSRSSCPRCGAVVY